MLEKIVAVVLDGGGNLYDSCFGWEAGQSYAMDGYIVRAIADDGDYWTVARQQSLYDSDLANFRDCFGVDTVPAFDLYVK